MHCVKLIGQLVAGIHVEAKQAQDALILFRANMGAYLRLYAFLSQIFDYGEQAGAGVFNGARWAEGCAHGARAVVPGTTVNGGVSAIGSLWGSELALIRPTHPRFNRL
jgi:hypothetical protein